MGKNILFNAHHSPVGAFASFTLGYPESSGGFDLELGHPPDQNIYIGLQADGSKQYQALPFFSKGEDERARFTSEQDQIQAEDIQHSHQVLKTTTAYIEAFPEKDIKRHFEAATDEWQAGDLTFKLY